MCYSAMQEQAYKEYCRDYGALIDREAFADLFRAREKQRELKIPDGMAAALIAEGGTFGKSIAKSHAIFLAAEVERTQAKIKDAEKAILELEAKKPGKTRDKNLETKLRVRDKLLASLQQSTQSGSSYRFYPYQFGAVIAEIDGKRLLTPMRYRILQANGFEVPDKYNVYNARRDSLTSAKTWQPLFGFKHALVPFTRFFEWVDRDGRSVEINFNPDGYSEMWAASLYEETPVDWGLMRSFAMVTDNPPPEVAAAGHDRCPIFIDEHLIDQWLRPAGQTLAQLDALLEHKQSTHYSHKMAA